MSLLPVFLTVVFPSANNCDSWRPDEPVATLSICRTSGPRGSQDEARQWPIESERPCRFLLADAPSGSAFRVDAEGFVMLRLAELSKCYSAGGSGCSADGRYPRGGDLRRDASNLTYAEATRPGTTPPSWPSFPSYAGYGGYAIVADRVPTDSADRVHVQSETPWLRRLRRLRHICE
jgi:hypothetical protein